MNSLEQEQAALEQGLNDDMMGGDNGDSNGELNDSNGGLEDNKSNVSLDGYIGKGRNAKHMTPLPDDFQPSEMDVICGRGKRIWEWKGNERFRQLVSAKADAYAAATTRTDKTFIVSSIVAEVRKQSPRGGFVKKDATSGKWFEVGDFNAHEKTSQAFRDSYLLHGTYLSSNKSKKKRRDLFRTNSKKRFFNSKERTINASSGRYMAGNVKRHYSYGSPKRAHIDNRLDLFRQHNAVGPVGAGDLFNAEQTDSTREETLSANGYEAQERFHNSWGHSSAASVYSEPGGKLFERNNIFSRHSSHDDNRGLEALHQSFADFRHENLAPLELNNRIRTSSGDYYSGSGTQGFANPRNDSHHGSQSGNWGNASAHSSVSFSYYPVEPPATTQSSAIPLSISVPADEQDAPQRYHQQQRQQQQQQVAGPPPGLEPGMNFELEFEDDAGPQTLPTDGANNLSIVDALNIAGYSSQTRPDDNPFEPIPVSTIDNMDLEPDPL